MNPRLTPPLLSAREAAEFEKTFFGGDEGAEWTAMLAAGKGIAGGVARDWSEIGPPPRPGRILVLTGKGHNGGDALLAAAELLRLWPEAEVEVVFAFGDRGMKPLALRAWQDLQQAARGRMRVVGAPGAAGWTGAKAYDVAIDGVFGFQYRPPLPAEAAALLRRVNGFAVRLRAAVDLPSGGDEPDGFRADFTYATGVVKAEAAQAANAGRLRYLDLGFFARERDVPSANRVLTEGLLDPLRGLRPARGDKRTYGHVFIVGGSRSFPGAVLMNTLAALHSGVGLVTAFVPESLAPAYAARAPEAMWVGCPETPHGGLALEGRHLIMERLQRATALALGSGLDRQPETLALVREVVAGAKVPVLLDGDALQKEIVAAAGEAPLLLTPHAGEFERLAGKDADLRAFSAGTGATVVLKGPVTRLCSGATAKGARKRAMAGLPVYWSFFGGPVLSRGGSGDVLAGLCAGQLALVHASRPEPAAGDWPSELLAGARGTVWHGLAADALARARGQTAVVVTDLIGHLADVLRG